ncbi:MAG: hypothetical protein RLZZ31_963 [Actinomycetota bacterium]
MTESAKLTTFTATGTVEQRAALPLRRVLADIGLLTQRNLRRILLNPRLLVFTTIQPLLQLIMFTIVFGAVATAAGDIPYKDFVVPAVLVQTMTFAAMSSGVGIARDLEGGMIERFRSLPIARSAFLLGRTVSDSTRLTIQALLLLVAALIIGFRFHSNVFGALAMIVSVVLFGIALTAFSAWVGLSVRDPEVVQAAIFLPLLPLVFTSSAFAPIDRLPGWMQPVANINPITSAIDTARGFALGSDRLYAVSGHGLGHSLLRFALWWIGIVVVFTWLAVRRYRRG